MNDLIEELFEKYATERRNNVSILFTDFQQAIQTACKAQRNACQRIVEDYGSNSELDSIEQLYEAVGNATIDNSDYIKASEKKFLLIRHFDTQPLLTVPNIDLAYKIVDKMKPWVVDIVSLDVEHFSYMPEDSDIEIIAKNNQYVSPITKEDYE